MTFYSYPYPLTVKKNSFLFFTEGGGGEGTLIGKNLLSKFFPLRVAPNEEGDGDGPLRNYILSPLEQNE